MEILLLSQGSTNIDHAALSVFLRSFDLHGEYPWEVSSGICKDVVPSLRIVETMFLETSPYKTRLVKLIAFCDQCGKENFPLIYC